MQSEELPLLDGRTPLRELYRYAEASQTARRAWTDYGPVLGVAVFYGFVVWTTGAQYFSLFIGVMVVLLMLQHVMESRAERRFKLIMAALRELELRAKPETRS